MNIQRRSTITVEKRTGALHTQRNARTEAKGVGSPPYLVPAGVPDAEW